MNKQARIWFKSAKDDLLWARHNLRGAFYAQACFAAQQAAEKALKAYLLEKVGRFDKVHLLPKLLRDCQKEDRDFRKLTEACDILADYYLDTRYPDMLDFSSFDDLKHAQEAIRLAKEIVEFVGERLGTEKETIEGEEFQKLMKSSR